MKVTSRGKLINCILLLFFFKKMSWTWTSMWEKTSGKVFLRKQQQRRILIINTRRICHHKKKKPCQSQKFTIGFTVLFRSSYHWSQVSSLSPVLFGFCCCYSDASCPGNIIWLWCVCMWLFHLNGEVFEKKKEFRGEEVNQYTTQRSLQSPFLQ